MSGLDAFRGRWFVVKIGGELAKNRAALSASVGDSVRAFLEAGIKVCVVHGAGPQATELSARLGLKTTQVGGRRVTDGPTLEVMKMALAGQVSVDVAAAFRMSGVPALCTTGVSAAFLEVVRRPPRVVEGGGPEPVDLGLVGDVVGVQKERLDALASVGLVPVLGSLGADSGGQVYNINADTVATRLASALGAAKLFLISNVPGVLRDRSDPSSRIPRLTPSEARAQIRAGTIAGGMVVKVEESLEMLEAGIDAIHIVGIEPSSALREEAEEAGRWGTAFVPESR